jgi:hypothetical protein
MFRLVPRLRWRRRRYNSRRSSHVGNALGYMGARTIFAILTGLFRGMRK